MLRPFLPLACAAAVLAVGCTQPSAPSAKSDAPAVKAEAPAPVPVPEARALQAPSPDLGQPLPSLAPLVDSVKSAVVNVDVQARVARAAHGGGFHPFFGSPNPGPQVKQGAGSGFIIDGAEGLVITNHHVIDDAVSIRVRLDDGRSFDGEVLGSDPLTDIALVKLKDVKEPLPSVKFGDSDSVRVGDYVVAIGNPFGLASTVSSGILSARARNIQAGPYDDFLQTDAAINPGNSGGPLFNLRGEVVGINTAIYRDATGIGFAVPANMARALLPQLEQGVVRRGWLGVGAQDLDEKLAKALEVPASGGALISQVTPDTPAEKAGLRADDVIVAVDGEKVASSRDLTRIIGFKQPGSQVKLTAFRGGEKKEIALELGERPNFEGVSTPQRRQSDEEKAQRIGLVLQDLDPRLARGPRVRESTGALVAQVVPGSPADDAGLKPGMIIVEADGKDVSGARDLVQILSGAESGKNVLLRAELGGGRVLRVLTIP